MKIGYFVFLLLPAMPVVAQPVFYSTSLPSAVGQYVRAYYSTNVDLAPWLALTNGAQYWDFSQPQQSNEIVLRTDIVPTDDNGDQASFPDAAYAQRYTYEPTNETAWEYYTLTSRGRVYYGLDDPVDDPVTPLAVFDPPTVDVPGSVQLGQTWNRSLYWLNVIFGDIVVSNYFSANATADAFGTLVLPSIGSVPALRVHEVQDYQSYEIISGFGSELIDEYTNQYYYWLVPGLAVAVEINSAPLSGAANTNSVVRVFASNYFTNQTVLGPVSGLQIQLQNRAVLLGWRQMSNAFQYQIESTTNLTVPNWQLSGLQTSNGWSDAVMGPQKFYRVLGLQ